MVKESKFNVDTFFYCGMLLITFDSFPFSRYGLGSNKSLSIIPLMLYIVLKTIQKKNNIIKISINNLMLIFSGSLLLIDSAFQGFTKYKNMAGFSRAVNMFAVFYITIFSFEIFIKNATKYSVIKMFKCIFKSFTISLFFGVLELIYFYIVKLQIIHDFILLFVRDQMYLDVRRLQFNFGEAGNTGVMIGILFPLTIIALKKLGYNFKKREYLKIGLILIISIFSAALNYLTIICILIISYIILGNGKNQKLHITIIIIFLISLFIINQILKSNWFLQYSLSSNSRILSILVNFNNIYKDSSIQTRLGFFQISINSFLKKPITGYGLGYYTYAFRENFNTVNPLLKTWEMIEDLKRTDLQDLGIIFSAISEGGVIGIFFMITLFSCFKNTPKFWKPFIIAIIVEMLQNIFIYWISLIIAFCIITNPKIKKMLNNNLTSSNKSTA